MHKAILIRIDAVGDGVSTELVFDLLVDPFTVGSRLPGMAIMNWFADKQSATPVKIIPSGSSPTASLSGATITINFGSAPPEDQIIDLQYWLVFN